MEPEEAIKLLLEHDQTTVAVVNSSARGEQAASRKHKQSAKKVLTALMGREPTEEELRQATGW